MEGVEEVGAGPEPLQSRSGALKLPSPSIILD